MIKEREETVKSDIFNVYITILQQTRPLVIKPKQQFILNGSSGNDFEDRAVSLLKGQINSIVKSIQKLLKNKNAKTRQGCFSLLTQLVNVLPGALSNYMAQIIPGINYSLKYKNFILLFYSLIQSLSLVHKRFYSSDKASTSNMKIDTLNFLNNLMLTHDEKLFHPYLNQIVPVFFT